MQGQSQGGTTISPITLKLPSVFASPTFTHNTCDELVWAEDLEAQRCRCSLVVHSC